MTGRVGRADLFSRLPPALPGELQSAIRAMVAARPNCKLAVLSKSNP